MTLYSNVREKYKFALTAVKSMQLLHALYICLCAFVLCCLLFIFMYMGVVFLFVICSLYL